MDRVSPSQYTYADLRRVHLERLEAAQKSKAEISNQSSALNMFMAAIGRTEHSTCNQDFGDRFDASLTRFTEVLSAKGGKSASISNKLAHIRAFRVTYRSMISNVAPTGAFASALVALMQTRQLDAKGLAKLTGLDDFTVYNWATGRRIPQKSSITNIRKLEAFFRVREGALLDKVFPATGPVAPRLESRRKRQKLIEDRYVYNDPCERIREEWRELLAFATAPYLANGMKRNASWRVKPADQVTCEYGWAALAPGGVCVTSQLRWFQVSCFFGFLLRSTSLGGKGMQESQLSLALLSDAKLALEYLEFKRQRAGVYTGDAEKIPGFWNSLTRPETGFLWQKPEYGSRLPSPVASGQWREWCETNRKRLREAVKELKKGGHIKQGRNPQEPIQAILAEPSPIKVLIQMTERMEQQFTLDCRKTMLAIRKRNLLLVKMLISNPLRVHNFSVMAYRRDNSGNLYKTSYGEWRLRFRPEDFKNQRGAASNPYDVVLPKWIYEDITEYLQVHRPVLLSHKSRPAMQTDRVFVPKVCGDNAKNHWSPQAISNCLLEITKAFVPGSPGFGIHAFRHIIATDYIKNNPNGFQVVANILHDKLETVLQAYAHLKVSDGFSHWSYYLEGQVSAVRGYDDE